MNLNIEIALIRYFDICKNKNILFNYLEISKIIILKLKIFNHIDNKFYKLKSKYVNIIN